MALISALKEQIHKFQEKVSMSSKSFSVKDSNDTLLVINAATNQNINTIYKLRAFTEQEESKLHIEFDHTNTHIRSIHKIHQFSELCNTE